MPCRQLWSLACGRHQLRIISGELKISKQRSPVVAEVATVTSVTFTVTTIVTCLRPNTRVLVRVAAGTSNPSWSMLAIWLLYLLTCYCLLGCSRIERENTRLNVKDKMLKNIMSREQPGCLFPPHSSTPRGCRWLAGWLANGVWRMTALNVTWRGYVIPLATLSILRELRRTSRSSGVR
jgi:hypothetical protein